MGVRVIGPQLRVNPLIVLLTEAAQPHCPGGDFCCVSAHDAMPVVSDNTHFTEYTHWSPRAAALRDNNWG